MNSTGLTSERGAIIIQVLVALLAMTGFMAFAADYGLKWVSRSQAQNAADAGAMAGAIALAFDDPSDYSVTGPAKVSAHAFALANDVWGQDPSIDIATDITFSSTDPAQFPPECATTNCIRVSVHRNQARGNPLPMLFGPLFGVTEQGVRATAIAWAAPGNATQCLRPWAVADKWNETDPGGWTPSAEFDPAAGDTYTAPTATDPGTGFTLEHDLGVELRLKVGQPHDAINPGWFQALDLSPGGGGGASEYESSIRGCSPHIWRIGDEIPKKTGNMVGPTGQGTDDLIDLDPGADWDPVERRVVNSCVETSSCVDSHGDPVQYAQSPRVVPVPVFDLAYYMQTGGPGNGTVRVVNILGFFVDRVQNPQNTVVGYLVERSDMLVHGGGSVAPAGSFIRAIQLVR